MAAGQCVDAIAALHQVLALELTHHHVAGRLAEVEWWQHVTHATPHGNTTVSPAVRGPSTRGDLGAVQPLEQEEEGVPMPTIRVVLRQADSDGKIITKRYHNATAHVHPITNMLHVSRHHGPSGDEEVMLAEFSPHMYLYWK